MRRAIRRRLVLCVRSGTQSVIDDRLLVVVDHALHELDVGLGVAAAAGVAVGDDLARRLAGAPGWTTLRVAGSAPWTRRPAWLSPQPASTTTAAARRE